MNASISINKKVLHEDSVMKEITSFKFENQDIDKKISSFSLGIFDIIYRIGKLGNKPLAFLAERFQTLRFKDDSIKPLTAMRLGLIGLLALPAVIFSLPGNAICALLKKLTQNFAYSPTTTKTASLAPVQAEIQKLKTLTWNTGLGPGFMAIDNRLKKAEERVGAVMDLINAQDPHIVCLQEVFAEGATETLVRELNEKGYDVLHSALCSSQIKLPSGLLLAVKRESGVKLEIEEVKVWEFKNLAGGDAMSKKALMGAKIKMTNGQAAPQHLHVFNTHLQSSYAETGYGEVRRDQIAAIAQKVKEWAGNNTAIVCGDLNFGAKPLEPSDDRPLAFADEAKPAGNEYDVQFDTFNRIGGLVDYNQAAQNAGNGTFYELKKGHPERIQSVVDYVLINKSLKQQDVHTEILPLNTPGQTDFSNLTSDHCPIVQTVALKALKPHQGVRVLPPIG